MMKFGKSKDDLDKATSGVATGGTTSTVEILKESVCVCVCVCARERERVCVKDRERERVCVCVRERERVCVCVNVLGDAKRHHISRERGNFQKPVCACVCVCV